MQISVSTLRCLVCVVAVFAAGCGGGGLPEGATGKVSGKVTLNGNPVPEGTTVVFMRQSGGYTATAATDASGAYQLSFRNAPEILVGKYNGGVTPPAVDSGLTPDEIMERGMKGDLPQQPKSPIPERYLNAETAGLLFDVKEGENSIDIELTN